MTLRLCLIAINRTELKDKITGEKTIKFKYVFLSEKNEAMVGWSDEKVYEDRLLDSNTYNDNYAHAYKVGIDVFNGVLQKKVFIEPLIP